MTLSAPPTRFTPPDYFKLRYPTDPQISPDGALVAYVRMRADAPTDSWHEDLCIVDAASGTVTELGTGTQPRWSPDGATLVFTRSVSGTPEVAAWQRGAEGTPAIRLVALPHGAEGLSWSPDGRTLAFVMFVPEAQPAAQPHAWEAMRTAQWAPPPVCTQRLVRRVEGVDADLPDGHHQVFLYDLATSGLRQLTQGPWNHGGPLVNVTKMTLGGRLSWTPDNRHIVLSMQRDEPAAGPVDGEATIASDVYEFRIADGAVRRLTRFGGPVCRATVSPDGQWIAFVGFRNQRKSFHTNLVHVMPREGGEPRALPHPAAMEVHQDIQWQPDSQALLALLPDAGDGCLVRVGLDGHWTTLRRDVGGSTASGYVMWSKGFSVANDGQVAYLQGSPERTDEVAVLSPATGQARTLTSESQWLLERTVSRMEPLTVATPIPMRGWLLRPPGVPADQKVPLILWLHGGPYLAWSPHFSLAPQLWAARGYAVLMLNPRGSLGYGEAYTELLQHAFPDADDLWLLQAVDEVVARGGIDADRVFVAGESAGGVLTSWLIGHSARFKAAAVIYGVMDWTSQMLSVDRPDYFPYYWLPDPPWVSGNIGAYWQRSPMSLADRVTTPAMVMCGDRDWRTPFAQSEMYFTALKLSGVDAALVRFPGANHGLEGHPSHWMALIEHTDAWFRRHGG